MVWFSRAFRWNFILISISENDQHDQHDQHHHQAVQLRDRVSVEKKKKREARV